MPERRDVAQFLNDFKAAVSLEYVCWLRRMDDAKEHLSGLQINRNEAIEILHGLTADNYCRGPEPDDFEPNRDIWIFGWDVAGTEAYIKLTLQQDPRRRTVIHAVIWSFHAAEHPLRYPLRQLS